MHGYASDEGLRLSIQMQGLLCFSQYMHLLHSRGIVMSLDLFRHFLLGSLLTNYVILLIWFLVFGFARSWMHDLHSRWFQLSAKTFDTIHYSGMAIYKIGIFLFNLTPLLVLWIMSA